MHKLLKLFKSLFEKEISNNQRIITAENPYHLESLIVAEIKKNGYKCDLNHIDVSQITDMSFLFQKYPGNKFNGDISKWDTSNVTTMRAMFTSTKFNGDISCWDVSKVRDMESIFHNSNFTGDLNKWEPYQLASSLHLADSSKFHKPYWSGLSSNEKIVRAIKTLKEKSILEQELNDITITTTKKKVKL